MMNQLSVLSPHKTLYNMTSNEEIFAQDYSRHGSLGKACRMSGLSRQYAKKLLEEPDVKKYIDELKQDQLVEADIYGMRVLEELSAVAFSNITDFVEWDTYTDPHTGDQLNRVYIKDSPDKMSLKAVKSVTLSRQGDIKIEMHSKMDALEKLAKILNLYTEKVEVTGQNGEPIKIEEYRSKILSRIIGQVATEGKDSDNSRDSNVDDSG